MPEDRKPYEPPTLEVAGNVHDAGAELAREDFGEAPLEAPEPEHVVILRAVREGKLGPASPELVKAIQDGKVKAADALSAWRGRQRAPVAEKQERPTPTAPVALARPELEEAPKPCSRCGEPLSAHPNDRGKCPDGRGSYNGRDFPEPAGGFEDKPVKKKK